MLTFPWRRSWASAAVSFVFVALAQSVVAVGAVGAEQAVPRAQAPSSSGVAQIDFTPLADARGAMSHLIDKQSQFMFAAVVVGVASAHQVDPSMREYFAHGRRIGDLDRLGNEVLGTGVPGALLGAGLWAWGASAARDSSTPAASYEVHAGQAQLESLAGTALATFALKGSVRRDRPDGSDQFSFPSGHTSTMAASAMSLQEFYGWKAGVPLFALTAVTAASRMTADVHWFSDTVAGAGLGILVGHAVSRPHLDRLEKPAVAERFRPMILPLVSPEGASLVAIFEY